MMSVKGRAISKKRHKAKLTDGYRQTHTHTHTHTHRYAHTHTHTHIHTHNGRMYIWMTSAGQLLQKAEKRQPGEGLGRQRSEIVMI
jgi:ABC-type Zn2+ transport system substrate-binding protein/surface adhesin